LILAAILPQTEFPMPASSLHLTLKIALLCLGLAASSASAQVTDAGEARLAPKAVLTANGVDLPAQAGVQWQLFTRSEDGQRLVRVAHGAGAEVMSAPAGDYVLSAKLDRAEQRIPVTLSAGTLAEPVVVLNAGRLVIRPHLQIEDMLIERAGVFVTTADGAISTHFGPTELYVPAGSVDVEVVFDAVSLKESLTIVAGDTTERSFTPEAGAGRVTFYLVQGVPVSMGRPRIDIFAPNPGPDGRLQRITYDALSDRTFVLPAGTYIAQAMLQGAVMQMPLWIGNGLLSEVEMTLNAGTLVIDAPGAASIAIYRMTGQESAPRHLMTHQWDATALSYILPAGEYQVDILRDDKTLTQPVTVHAGMASPLAFAQD